jgi:putative MATE family efflux protein
MAGDSVPPGDLLELEAASFPAGRSFWQDLRAATRGGSLDLTQGGIFRNLWIVALPQIVANVVQNVFNLVDMFWVGRLGTVALAAVGIAGTIMMVLFMVILGAGTGAAAIVARAIGAGDREDADRIAAAAILLAVLLSLPVAVLGFLHAPALYTLMGADAAVTAAGAQYIRVMFLGAGIIFSNFVLNSLFQGAGDAVSPMLATTFAAVLNALIDPIFIFGWLGTPRLGVAGAAWATLVARGVSTLILVRLLCRPGRRLRLRLAHFVPDLRRMRRILRLGIPNSLQLSFRGVMGIVLMGIVSRFGTIALAAYSVGGRLSMLALFPGFGFATAAGTLVGQNLGAKKPQRSWRSAYAAVGAYAATLLPMSLAFLLLPRPLIAVFDATPEVVAIGSTMLRILASTLLFLAPAIVLSRALAGAGDTVSPMVITAACLWGLQVPLAMVLPHLGGLGVNGVFLAAALSTVAQGALALIWFQRGHWVHRRV